MDRVVARHKGSSALLCWVLAAFLALAAFSAAPAFALEKAQLLATNQNGFARLILYFPGRADLPQYKVKYDNGVLAIEFQDPVDVLLPDVAAAIPDYVTIAREDPDQKGLRIGLRTTVNLSRLEAGERLFIDLLPLTWQGLPPALPPEVVAELSDRAKKAAEKAAADQKIAESKRLSPKATIGVGLNPTFMRIQFDWSEDTVGKFSFANGTAQLVFDWPVALDLYPLQGDMPRVFKGAKNQVNATNSVVQLSVADGTVPRFYQVSPRSFIVDIDVDPAEGLQAALAAEEAAKKAKAEAQPADGHAVDGHNADGTAPPIVADAPGTPAEPNVTGPEGPVSGAAITPTVTTVGGTVRISFPFETDTASAVFRRGDDVWLVFDTRTPIGAPAPSKDLGSVASAFDITPGSDTQVVRIALSNDRLATLASEGRAWVLSLGDALLGATEPMALDRQRNSDGTFSVTADLQRPGRIHQLNDPAVGDTLTVVTVLPPARGIARDLRYVDFTALRSAQGLVIKPLNDKLSVAIDQKSAIISAADGLTLSNVEGGKPLDIEKDAQSRESYIDLAVFRETDPRQFWRRVDEQMDKAATGEGRLKDVARLDLATLYLANGLSYEAIGVLSVAKEQLNSPELGKRLQLLRAMADTMAGRPREALATLTQGTFPQEADALMWRAMARAEDGDFAGARLDALGAEPIVGSYPDWLQKRFFFAALRAAVETNDNGLAQRMIGDIDFPSLEPDEISLYQLMQGRISEMEGATQDALDSYGQVIASEVRPTRAEAVFRTLRLLKQSGKIDLKKAISTLAAESLLWRGDRIEAQTDALLADLYFENKDYRAGFDTAKQAALYFPQDSDISGLTDEARAQFENLFLNGAADQLPDVDALALFYDFRELTPPGTRGDELIRNLARRLVKVDLLPQAGDLLQYQIDNRLTGIGKAQVAADLAAIRLADRNPEAALKALGASRLSNLPPELERQRRVLEARAMIDSGRQDLAIDMVSKLQGRDVDLLRIDGYWKAKNYQNAAQLLEVLHAPQSATDQMSQDARLGILKAAVGYVLADDKLSLARLRSKFGDQMANSPEWPLFDYVTGDISAQGSDFKKIAAQVANVDSLDAFLKAYQQLYTATPTPSG